MASLWNPSGPLSPAVYWRRRLLVLVVVGVLGVAMAGAWNAIDSGPTGHLDKAVAVAAEQQPSPPARINPVRDRPATLRPEPTQVLADPDGPCQPADVSVEPVVHRAVAGQDVRIRLRLRTLAADACTWTVDGTSVTVKITSGNDPIFSTQQCPSAVGSREVVVRDVADTVVTVVWHGRRSDDECSRLTDWALPGWYHVEAAALGGEPAETQFELTAPRKGTPRGGKPATLVGSQPGG